MNKGRTDILHKGLSTQGVPVPECGDFSPQHGDWLFARIGVGGMAWAVVHYSEFMDGYEQAILAGSAPALDWAGFGAPCVT